MEIGEYTKRLVQPESQPNNHGNRSDEPDRDQLQNPSCRGCECANITRKPSGRGSTASQSLDTAQLLRWLYQGVAG